jgi:CDP-4-dehydro-6-deoxyglucose reductase
MAEAAQVTILNTGESYACPAGIALLDAGLAAGLHIPHSCRGGACGTCKARVVAGSVDHGWVMSFAISDEEKAEGFCLTCQSKPASTRIVLQMVNPMLAREAESVIVPAEMEAQVLAAHKVTPTVLRLVLEPPPTMRFAFHAGQNLELVIPGLDQPRPYSMAHAPAEDGTAPNGQLVFYITRHDQGRASAWLHEHLRCGDLLSVRGPYGEFHLPRGDGPVLGLAGGTGLSPILSLVEQALASGLAEPVKLIVSVRERGEIFALEALVALARRYANFTFGITLTREKDAGEPWLTGRITALLEREKPDLSRTRVMIAGAPTFVDNVRTAVLARGAPAEAVAIDSFVSRQPKAPAGA